MSRRQQSFALPTISQPLMGGFLRFVRWYFRRHFHAFAVNQQHLNAVPLSANDALVVYANHASWWDPLSALYLGNQTFPDHRLYAPIDAKAFEKYRMFGKMGFFPVDQSSWRGAADFIRISTRILAEPASSIWLTPEGRFVDVRDADAPLANGLAHLAAKLSEQAVSPAGVPRPVWFVPGAVEYTFWEERKPELLCWFGQPVCVTDISCAELLAGSPRHDKSAWNRLLHQRLRDAQAELAAASIARDSSQFKLLLTSKSGSFVVYDWWRRLTARLQGRALDIDHSDKLRS